MFFNFFPDGSNVEFTIFNTGIFFFISGIKRYYVDFQPNDFPSVYKSFF
jgi:hypothetical protein